MGFQQALAMIERNGGKIEGDEVTIACQQPVAVKYEKNFEGLFPVGNRHLNKSLLDISELAFDGTGIVLRGEVQCVDKSYTAQVEVYIDDQLAETADLPADYVVRRVDLFWKYQLPNGQHKIRFKWLNPRNDAKIWADNAVIYAADI
jgi:hypothetical protein